MSVRQNMCCVQQLAVAESADAARLTIGKEDALAECLLVETPLHQRGDVPTTSVGPDVRGRTVHVRKCRVLSNDSKREMLRIIAYHEDRPDRFVQTWHNSV